MLRHPYHQHMECRFHDHELMMDPDIETIFLMAHQQLSHVSGTLLRQIAALGGNLEPFVSPEIREVLIARATKAR